jgi:hypothetical protein
METLRIARRKQADNIKIGPQINRVVNCELISSTSGHESVMDTCEYGIESSGFIECLQCLDQLSNY